MKKTKFLALALVVALVLTGTAFAWWGETLTMSQTVKTGELNVVFDKAWTRGGDNTLNQTDYDVPTSGYPGWVEHEGQQWTELNLNFVPTKIRCDGDKVIAEVGNMYPGSRAQFEFVVKNIGSIPAVVGDVDTDLWDRYPYLADKMYIVAGAKVGDGDAVWKQGSARNLETIMTDLFKNLRLDPDQSASAQIFIYFDRDGTKTSGDIGEKDSITFFLEMDWTQFNAMPAA